MVESTEGARNQLNVAKDHGEQNQNKGGLFICFQLVQYR
jgi:hypothetical protein